MNFIHSIYNAIHMGYRMFKNNFRLLKDRTHISLFSQDSLIRFVRKYGFKVGKYPVAEKFFEMEVSLPIFYSLKEKDIKYVIRNIKTIIGVN